jgi:hypothetical protein
MVALRRRVDVHTTDKRRAFGECLDGERVAELKQVFNVITYTAVI